MCISSSFVVRPNHIISVVSNLLSVRVCGTHRSTELVILGDLHPPHPPTTVKLSAYNSFRRLYFVLMFLLISSTTAIKTRRSPLCQANIYFELSRHSRSTHHPALYVFTCPFSPPPLGPNPPKCRRSHFPLYGIINFLHLLSTSGLRVNFPLILHVPVLKHAVLHRFPFPLLLLFCHPGLFTATLA